MRTEAIEAGTGRTWPQWTEVFESIGAHALSHAEIVTRVVEQTGLEGWWAQAVVIHYEQQTGRRIEGQTSTGTFAANASRTLPGDLDSVLTRWIAHVDARSSLAGVPLDSEGRTSSTPKWRYWRCALADGSRVVVTVSAKSPEKVVLAVQNDGLTTDDERQERRVAWRAELAAL